MLNTIPLEQFLNILIIFFSFLQVIQALITQLAEKTTKAEEILAKVQSVPYCAWCSCSYFIFSPIMKYLLLLKPTDEFCGRVCNLTPVFRCSASLF